MKKPKNFGYAVNKEAAKELRREIQKTLKDGRKAHYLKITNDSGSQYQYWVWADPPS